MKSILLALLFLLIPKLAVSQVITANDDAVYLDSLYNMGNEKNYKYIRVIKDYKSPKKESYEVKDYYKSGKIAMSGTTSTRDKITKNGIFVYYYENGYKRAVTNYIKNVSVGKEYVWYENGNKKQEGEYVIVDEKKNVSKYKVNLYWDVNGLEKVTEGNGDYEESNENFFAKGKVKNGFKDGPWEGYNKNMEYTFNETYENQKLVSGVSLDKEKTAHSYTVVELKPMPKKGMEDFYRHISKNFRTPEISGLSGKIYVKFTVDKNGQIIKPEIIKGIGFGADEEAIRAVSSYANFAPGEIRGINVNCTFSIPISIQTAGVSNTKMTPNPSEMIRNTNLNRH